MQRILFIFRRDLRLEDNTALNFALQNSEEVILSFIFTPEQIKNNPYRSDRCLQFMIESLEDLGSEISKKNGTLYLFFGEPEKIVEKCIKSLGIDGVAFNRDYTPYSLKRDQLIEMACEKYKIPCHTFEDALLHPIEDTLKSDGTPYKIFTPYFNNAMKLDVRVPLKNVETKFYSKPIHFSQNASLYAQILPKRLTQQKGGRAACLKILESLQTFSNYSFIRDFPAKDGTTHLSPHLKFTTCSPREIYHAVINKLGKGGDELIRSLYWRDFFTSVGYYFPKVFQGPFKNSEKEMNWSENEEDFLKWCEGKTGFPIVDAGMRELNQTGFMHNRVRMIAASFLIKDLNIDWRKGEKYFAQTLIDYDPAVNNGNWQWVAGTGCDAQPYHRIFNPWRQGEKFDPDCFYIKKWVPELASLPPKKIHRWHEQTDLSLFSHHYLSPLVDHQIASEKFKESIKKT